MSEEAPRFSILAEQEAGHAAAERWLQANPEHSRLADIADLGRVGVPFSEQSPDELRLRLNLTEVEFWQFWADFGTAQSPSHSFSRGFCRHIGERVPTSVAAPPADAEVVELSEEQTFDDVGKLAKQLRKQGFTKSQIARKIEKRNLPEGM